ncbi:MAG: signal peptidase II [Pseudomonadota bacterium]
MTLGLAIAVATFAIDQANKWWFIAGLGMSEGQTIELTSFLNLYYTRNLGVSYGLFQLNSDFGQRILAGIAVLISLGFLVWLIRTGSRLAGVAIGLIVGGALGNALDRITLGGVADFYQLHGFGYSWYIFNIADVAIVLGAGLLILQTLFFDEAASQSGT